MKEGNRISTWSSCPSNNPLDAGPDPKADVVPTGGLFASLRGSRRIHETVSRSSSASFLSAESAGAGEGHATLFTTSASSAVSLHMRSASEGSTDSAASSANSPSYAAEERHGSSTAGRDLAAWEFVEVTTDGGTYQQCQGCAPSNPFAQEAARE